LPVRPASIMLAAMLCLAGCMMGPDYQTPDAPVNDTWQGPTGPSDPHASNPSWWESFNDPTLSNLVTEACRQNLPLRMAGLRVLEARAARGVAVGQFFPQLQEAAGSIGNHALSANDAGVTGDRHFATDAIGLQAAWELDFWGKFRRGIESADAAV